jgi:hypothetical protein
MKNKITSQNIKDYLDKILQKKYYGGIIIKVEYGEIKRIVQEISFKDLKELLN